MGGGGGKSVLPSPSDSQVLTQQLCWRCLKLPEHLHSSSPRWHKCHSARACQCRRSDQRKGRKREKINNVTSHSGIKSECLIFLWLHFAQVWCACCTNKAADSLFHRFLSSRKRKDKIEGTDYLQRPRTSLQGAMA